MNYIHVIFNCSLDLSYLNIIKVKDMANMF